MRLQNTLDQIPEATDFIDRTLWDMKLAGEHPWHASDTTLIKLAYAQVAWANDTAAEHLIKAGATTNWRGNPQATTDIATFARQLTVTAADRLQYAHTLSATQDQLEFDQDTINALAAEAQLPYWPISDRSAPTEQWQHESSGVITVPFIAAILDATTAFQAEALSRVTYNTDFQQTNADVPPEFASLAQVMNEIVEASEYNRAHAEQLLPEFDNADLAYKIDVYDKAHSAFVLSMDACIAAVCPPNLGPDFIPQR